ncbi:hypothetical protein ABZX40_12115 [Streptomyces sp. NPDC004610]|uniref:hypothetical protein n=1 Tax=unclassified Streptomyces TaxID=2593676 RepID=UPI0033BA7677
MCRSPRLVSLVLVAGAVVLGGAPGVAAEPAAEVSPARARPGGSVTVSVTCDPADGEAPRTLEATSRAFAEGRITLRSESGGDGRSGTRYRGTARIGTAVHPDGGARDAAWTVDGTCPASRGGGKGRQWSATFTVEKSGGGQDGGGQDGGGDDGGREDGGGGGGITHRPCPPEQGREWSAYGPGEAGRGSGSCEPPPAEHGVHAGSGGTFTDSVPALVGGGLLIAGACGGAAYRLRRGTARARG